MNEENERRLPYPFLLTNKEMLKGVLKKKLISSTFPMEETMVDVDTFVD